MKEKYGRDRQDRQSLTFLRTGGIGGLSCVITTILLTLIIAVLMEKGIVSVRLTSAAGYAVIGLSALAGAVICTLFSKKKKLAAATVSGAIYMLFLLLGRLVLRGTGGGRVLPTAGIIIGIDLILSLVSTSAKKSKY